MSESTEPSIGIVVSRADGASAHVGEQLLELAEWERHEDEMRPTPASGGTVYRSGPFEVRTFEELHLSLEGVADAFDDVDLVVFASRHAGETGPLLTAHFTGNFGPAEYGGRDGELATAAPAALDRVVSTFERVAPDGYDVGIECTHHGPSDVGAPSLFVELGSDEPQWNDPDGARAVARAILSLGAPDAHGPPGAHGAPDAGDDDPAEATGRTVVGFGGGHYAPRFTRIRRETDWLIGHVGADWCLDALGDPAANADVIAQAFEKSGASIALVDGDWPAVEATVEDLGYRVVSETWVRETDGVPTSLVEATERRLGSVDDGLRFGSRARDADVAVDDLEFRSLPDELLSETLGVDAERTRECVRDAFVAYQTDENGKRPQGRAAIVGAAAFDRFVDDLMAVLGTKYDAVERDGDAVVARVSAFDPEAARALGVPEGPAFGDLAEGRAVEVAGERITPEAVSVEREVRFTVP